MLHILIDGYNLMAKMGGIGGSLEAQREGLLKILSQYRARKCHRVTVVFDGEKGGQVVESHERIMGIDVIFSKLGEKADDVIKRMVKSHAEEYTVITSDREIASCAEGFGHIAIPSEEFVPKLFEYRAPEERGEDEERGDASGMITTRKRGNPYRLSKAARRRKQKLERL